MHMAMHKQMDRCRLRCMNRCRRRCTIRCRLRCMNRCRWTNGRMDGRTGTYLFDRSITIITTHYLPPTLPTLLHGCSLLLMWIKIWTDLWRDTCVLETI